MSVGVSDFTCPYCGGKLEVLIRRWLTGDTKAVVEFGPVRCLSCGANSDDEDDGPGSDGGGEKLPETASEVA